MENFRSLEGKILYVHYDGAIRQMKLHSVECRSGFSYISFLVLWDIAGVEKPQEWDFDYKKAYFSFDDAESETNSIDYKEPNAADVNDYLKNCFVDIKGNIHYWSWGGSRAVEERLNYCTLKWENGTWMITSPKELPKEMYRTKKECQAHHRARLITF